MTKDQLRKFYLKERRNLSAKYVDELSQEITTHFLNSEFSQYQTFHIFISIEKLKEINTTFLIRALWDSDKTIVVPKMCGKDLLNCQLQEDSELTINSWGIREPQNCVQISSSIIDVVIVPLLICDANGNRLGYGGGFYDRFLSSLRADAKLIGISFFEPIEVLPAESHDIPLYALITPKGLITF